MKSITYAYPTSPNAAKHKHARTGCWVVRDGDTETAFPTGKGIEALHAFTNAAGPVHWASFFAQGDRTPVDQRARQIAMG